MNRTRMWIIGLSLAAGVAMAQPGNLQPNGGFEHPQNPFEGWTIDYEWNGNKKEADNKERIMFTPSLAGKRNVVEFPKHGGVGTKIESVIIPFDPTKTYEASLDVKGTFRIYFSGYKWKPGVRPHDKPTLGELRQIYRSQTATPKNKSWGRVSLKFPNKKPTSDLQKQHLSKIRFVTLYIWCEHGGAVDNVSILAK